MSIWIDGRVNGPRVRMSGVCKRFGDAWALRNVDLEVGPGEVHALVGENGAGKSTLMRILSGAVAADSGTITVDGMPLRRGDTLDARRHGVAMIYQELTLAPHLSVAANIVLGAEPARWGWLRARASESLARQALADLGHGALPLDASVGGLSVAQQQIVEIARALVGQPRLLVMDEPTSALGRHDTGALFQVIARLKALGVGVVYISHFLEECAAVADRYTVLRDGETVGSGPMAEASAPVLVDLMVGRSVDDTYPARAEALGDVALHVDGLSGRDKPRELSLEVRGGEILGIAGLVGAGRTETLRCLFGLDKVRHGTITLHGRNVGAPRPHRSLRLGLGMLSEDRKGEGLLVDGSIADNLTMTRLHAVTRLGIVSPRRQRQAAEALIQRLGIRALHPRQRVRDLSGGNQQKVAFGRLVHQGADVMLLDEPTRGVDVGAKLELYRLMRRLARDGRAIVFVSSYLPELLGVCDSIAVMRRGRLVDHRPATAWSEHELLLAAAGDAA